MISLLSRALTFLENFKKNVHGRAKFECRAGYAKPTFYWPNLIFIILQHNSLLTLLRRQYKQTRHGEMLLKIRPEIRLAGKSMTLLPLATFYQLTETVLQIKVEASAKFTNRGLLNNTNRHSHSA